MLPNLSKSLTALSLKRIVNLLLDEREMLFFGSKKLTLNW
jgi:hypothetical protein